MPRPRHGSGQRGSYRGRALRARQLPGLQAQPASVDDAHHCLRQAPGRRPRHHQLAREGAHHAAQLDRSLGGCDRPLRRARRARGGGLPRLPGCLHDAPRHTLRRDLHGRGSRAPDSRWHRRRRRGRRSRPHPAGLLARGHEGRVDGRCRHPRGGRERLPRPGLGQVRSRARRRRAHQDRRVHRPVRHRLRQRSRGPDLRRRLRPVGLRHRCHHGRARPRRPRLGLRPRLRPRRRAHHRTRRRSLRPRPRGRCVHG